jgi:hypothetical protein
MADFPAQPVSPQEFMEQFVPKAFAESGLGQGTQDVEVRLGVLLEGEGGGEWLFHVNQGALSVESGSRADADFSIVQSVEDWRGALWEGRGGAFGKQASAMFRPGGGAEAQPGAMGGPPSPAALGQLRALDGVIKMVVSGGEDGEWAVAFKLGPGEIPAEPTTTITVSAEDAEAMDRGELDPMQAFMAGRIQVAGDMTLMMQMQAIQMQAAAQAASAGGASGGAGGQGGAQS